MIQDIQRLIDDYYAWLKDKTALRQIDQWVEITSGIDAGQRYVAKNSFVLKADVGKSGAEHDH